MILIIVEENYERTTVIAPPYQLLIDTRETTNDEGEVCYHLELHVTGNADAGNKVFRITQSPHDAFAKEAHIILDNLIHRDLRKAVEEGRRVLHLDLQFLNISAYSDAIEQGKSGEEDPF